MMTAKEMLDIIEEYKVEREQYDESSTEYKCLTENIEDLEDMIRYEGAMYNG